MITLRLEAKGQYTLLKIKQGKAKIVSACNYTTFIPIQRVFFQSPSTFFPFKYEEG